MSAILARGRLRLPVPPRLKQTEVEDTPQPLVAHLEELRNRLVKATIGVMAATALSFLLIEQVMGVLIDLASPYAVQAIDPTETFGTYFKVAFSIGLGLSMPLIVYQLVRFLAPGLTRGERRTLYFSLPFVAIAFLGGVAFCYYVILPSALNFLLSFGDPRILKQVSLSKYVSFVTSFLLAVGASFETPIVILLLAKVGVVNYRRLAKWRKYALLLSFLVAAIITPTPDPINQAFVGLPLFLLYELGAQLSRFAGKK